MATDGHANTSVAVGFTNRFQQQGSLDWVSLSNNTISFSVGVLAQLAQGGVHPYTLTIGQYIGTSFRFSSTGRRSFELALSRLRCFGALDELLKFGFSVECLPRVLSTTEQGCMCAAICAALSEFYHEDVAAEILHELVSLAKIPHELIPSITEWTNLLSIFQGVLAATQFPLIVEQLAKLMRPTPQLRSGLSDRLRTPELYMHNSEPGYADSIAGALQALGSVSRKEMESVKIVGRQTDLAWLGTFAIWLLGLKVTITTVDDSSEQLIYSNCQVGEEQVEIVYAESNSKEDKPLELSRTYQLTGGFNRLVDSDAFSENLVTSGRVAWKNCFSATFGSSFQRLLDRRTVTGTIIGSAARILEGFYRAEITSTGDPKITHIHYLPFGHDLLRALGRFTELSALNSTMQRAVLNNLGTAESEFEANLCLLRSACGCAPCRSFEEGVPSSVEYIPASYCLVVLVETIMIIGRLLGTCNIADELFPTRSGLEYAYTTHYRKRQTIAHEQREDELAEARENTDSDSDDHKWKIEFLALTDFTSGTYVRLLHEDFETPDAVLKYIWRIFTGRSCTLSSIFSAYAASGICVYLETLSGIPEPEAPLVLVNVVPGRIEYRGRYYDRVSSTVDNRWEGGSKKPRDAQWDISFLVTPKVDRLDATYQAKAADEIFPFSPYQLVQGFGDLARAAHCPTHDCPVLQTSRLESYSKSYGVVKVQGRKAWVFVGDKKSICVNLVRFHRALPPAQGSFRVVLQQDSCLDCCFRLVAQNRDSPVEIVVFKRED